MSIEYEKQKINLAVIIIDNFHKSNFECFQLDDGGSTRLKAIYYIQGLDKGSPKTIYCTILGQDEFLTVQGTNCMIW